MDALTKLLQPESYPLFLDILDKEINVKPYSHGDTKAFLELIDDHRKKKKGGMKKLFYAQKNLIDACILPGTTGEKPVKAHDLHRADYVKLLVYLKNITHGENTKVNFRCSNERCEDDTKQRFIQTLVFGLDDCTLHNKERNPVVQYTMEDGTTVLFNMKPYTFGLLIDNAELFETEIPSIELVSRYQASFVDSIEVNGDPMGDIPFTKKTEIMTAMLPKYKKHLAEYIEKEPMWTWENTWECPVCGATNRSVLDGISDFFV